MNPVLLKTDPVRVGMVGGGPGAFIGAVHRAALALDREGVLVAGAFSSDPDRSVATAMELGLDPARGYASWREMIEREAARPVAERIEAVSIVTPNDTHADIACGFLDAGFAVIVDKPMTRTEPEARRVVDAAERSGRVAAVTYNYSGYPMVREMRSRVRAGAIGRVRRVFAEYHQGWLAHPIEQSGQKQASWRTDPARAGDGGSLGDIGTHAEQLIRFVTGHTIDALACETTAFGVGRSLDDDAAVLLRLSEGARGTLTCSQVCIGEQNGLSLRIYGDAGSLKWHQEQPEHLWHADTESRWSLHTRGGPTVGPGAAHATRLPGGHPEGFLEAFANLYRGAFRALRGEPDHPLAAAVPTARDGLAGVRFVAAAVESSRCNAKWVELDA